MKFAVSIPPFCPVDEVIALATSAEASGWDAVFLWDHLQYERARAFEIHDPWVLLGAIGQATERVVIGPMITPLARRRPQVVAKHVTTLDHLTGGRTVLGVGLGWPADDDFEAFDDSGDDRSRGDRLDEALTVLTDLWAGPTQHLGSHFRISADLHPRPLTTPHPPIWVGSLGARRPERRALKYQGIVPLHSNGEPLAPDDVAALVERLAPPTGFDVACAWRWDESPDDYAAAGATWLIESRFPDGDWLAELHQIVARPPG